MRVQWEIDDGYVGKARPHYLDIDDDELSEYETEESKDEYIAECIQNEFDSTVSFQWEKA